MSDVLKGCGVTKACDVIKASGVKGVSVHVEKPDTVYSRLSVETVYIFLGAFIAEAVVVVTTIFIVLTRL